MDEVRLYTAINKESKYWGLKAGGIAMGAIWAFCGLLLFSETIAVFAAVGGYIAGSYISSLWHLGILQRWCFWYLPVKRLFGKRYLPASHLRIFL